MGSLRTAVVLRVGEDDALLRAGDSTSLVRFADRFPRPRAERVSPGHLVAVMTAPDGAERVVWRWFDAVVIGTEDDGVRVWEPAHGEVLARPRRPERTTAPGTRAWASAGLPGADWWLAGPVTADPGDADVERDEVADLCRQLGLLG